MLRRRASALSFVVVVVALATRCGPAEDQAGSTGTHSYALPLIADEGFWMGVYHPLNDVVMAERDGVQVIANGNLAVSVAERTSRARSMATAISIASTPGSACRAP